MSDIDAVVSAAGPGGEAPTEPRHASKKDKPRSLAADAWIDLRKSKIFWFAAVLVVIITLMAVWPGLFGAGDPRDCNLSRQHDGPTGNAFFGFDYQGCDIYAKTIYGARNSLQVSIVATLLAGIIGLIFGLGAGYFGGWVDAVLSRFIDVVLGIPFLLAAIVLAKRLSADPSSDGVMAVTLTLGFLGWTTAARIMRSSVIASKNQDYVAAARMLGSGPARLMMRHILPNSTASFIVVLTLLLGTNIASEATLSYLGIGLKNDAISWGISIAEAGPLARVEPGPLIWPSVFLAATVLAFIMLGDAVRDAFDPKLR
ncbi:ABC transporter permease [Couchioplanes caeruleus]|uniref:Peptide ABC transporter permease n=2 Tax=Couchioplanes caeruleus TaxID=56438 RepID=A0A1K0GES0_9ACTN|nr:ABC transporter permease [Couchioplanes caeruleus]OJF10646.1 peptide ABC transporter permease [Couchioplanes caeruleus subsp. caeruleus]ROP30154.1 peptide/nickel transport system permease protein/oligopeptide transport system permease protein [Couchioplanes caeruleus]